MHGEYEEYYAREPLAAAQMGDVTIALDASILLGLYAAQQEPRKQFLKVLRSVKQRLWLPYQAGREYQRNRLRVIRGHARSYDDLLAALDGALAQARKTLAPFKGRDHPRIDWDKHESDLKTSVEHIKERIKKMRDHHPDLENDDGIRRSLDSTLKSRTGQAPTSTEFLARCATAERRTELRLPPGYMDASKQGALALGDALIWQELLEEAARRDGSMLFVTDDRKEDWWLLDDDGVPTGPRPELVREMREDADTEYYQLGGADFLDLAQRHLGMRDASARSSVEEIVRRERDEMEAQRVRIASMLAPTYNPLIDLQDTLSKQASMFMPGVTVLKGLSDSISQSLAEQFRITRSFPGGPSIFGIAPAGGAENDEDADDGPDEPNS